MLKNHLQPEKYGNIPANELAMKMLQHAKSCVKKCDIPRYKFMCHVTLDKKTGQSLANVSRCLWDEKTDSFASAEFQNASLYCVVTVFWVYLA